MAVRRFLGCLPIAALVVGGATACKDKGTGDAAKTQASAADLDQRCQRLGKLCADKVKHVDKLIAECQQDAKQQVEHGCTAQVIAVYDCYEKSVCSTGEKVWALGDLHVLAERHGKCVAERKASSACPAK